MPRAFREAMRKAGEAVVAKRYDEARQILRDALNAFDDAVARVQNNPTEARELYRRAAASFEALTTAGLRNAALEYNLGNTYFRLDELRRAIVHYRRALRLDRGRSAPYSRVLWIGSR